MKTLVLITSQFPFGTGETFIGSEFPVLAENFGKIILISQNISSDIERPTSGNTVVYRYNTATRASGLLFLPLLIISNISTILRLYTEEVTFRKSTNFALTSQNKLSLLRRILKAFQLKTYIRNVLRKEGINEPIVFYSYWLKTGAHALAMLEYKNSIRIARAHGSDIYEERTVDGYLPLLNFSAKNLDAVFFTSDDGIEYFKEKTRTDTNTFFVSKLGVNKPAIESKLFRRPNRYTIVSCSNMIPLKRIDIIIHALSFIESAKDIEWIHFGDGILKKSLEELAESILNKGKLKFRFMGHYPNEELLKYYAENRVDLFINTSSTEGIPVSIMEAQAYGIPVIATDIGGVREIISKESGSLLPVDLNPGQLATEIEYYLNLEEKDTEALRINAFNNWNLKYNALTNYRNFITELSSILDKRK